MIRQEKIGLSLASRWVGTSRTSTAPGSTLATVGGKRRRACRLLHAPGGALVIHSASTQCLERAFCQTEAL
jgi:hypothetical protein